jgi:hypothetical protein
MAEGFGLSQVIDYLHLMGLQISTTHPQQELLELAFHGHHGQWRLVISFQQANDARKLVLVAPHIAALTQKKRLECLEALMAVNYRIAIGKFGLDLADGEVRLEESVPLAHDGLTFAQFEQVFRALVQTVAMYHSLIPRILYGNLTTIEALHACEQDYFQDEPPGDSIPTSTREYEQGAELDVNEVLEEARRLLRERQERQEG